MNWFDNVESVIISALFVSQEPLSLNELYRILNNRYVLENKMRKISKKTIEEFLDNINVKFEKLNLPLVVEKKPNNSYDIVVRDYFFNYVVDLAPKRDFSRATLQTLALIAYKSPIEQKEVIRIRGQRAYEQIKELLNRGFVISERKGHTNLLRVSKKFLDYFGLKNEKELKKFLERNFIGEEDFN